MRSRTSFFNKAFSLHLLRRFWPLWALWLVLLLVIGVGDPLGYSPESYMSYSLYVQELNRVILEVGVALVYCAIAAGPLVAMAMLGYLYSPRACNMVCALPMRREETYFTAVLTGLAPLLAADVLVWLLLLALFGRVEGIDLTHIHLWLGLAVMGNVAFYGFACFCGVLTGNTVVLPLVYVALGCAAVVIENTTRDLLELLVYGYNSNGELFKWLSPIPCVLTDLGVYQLGAEGGVWAVHGVSYLAGFTAAGIVLLLLGALILKKRHMETAGDIVAVPVLRPIFRVCMAVGMSLVFTCFGSDAFFGNRPPTAAVFTLLILGAALGYFMAEMLIRKTLRVFDHGWKQLALICLCLALPFVLAELDVTGYETRVPETAQIESAAFGYDVKRIAEPESLAAFTDFHRALIAHKAENEQARRRAYTTIPLTYTMKDGKTLTRLYRVPKDERAQTDPDSDIAAWQKICNLPELILRRTGADRPFEADEVRSASVELRSKDRGGWAYLTIALTPGQAVSLFEEGVWPDAREGNIGRWYAYVSDESRLEQSNVEITLELTGENEDAPLHVYAENGAVHTYRDGDYYCFTVLMSSAHTIQWLEKNLSVTPVREAELG